MQTSTFVCTSSQQPLCPPTSLSMEYEFVVECEFVCGIGVPNNRNVRKRANIIFCTHLGTTTSIPSYDFVNGVRVRRGIQIRSWKKKEFIEY